MTTMQKKALVIIDLQNDITKNYREIIAAVNTAIDWAKNNNIHIVYIKQLYLSDTMRTFKPNTRGFELVTELNVVTDNIFIKQKGSVLSSEAFSDFINANEISEFYLCGADATVCVKISCNGLLKAGYQVKVISDCVTSYSKQKIPEMLAYYTSKGCELINLQALLGH